MAGRLAQDAGTAPTPGRLRAYSAFARLKRASAAAVCCALTLACAEPCLKEASDFEALAREAADRKLAILVEFAVSDCEYCHYVEEKILKPMLRSGEYADKLLIRRLRYVPDSEIRNFTGRETRAKALAQRYGVRLAPTVMLIDAQGQPLSMPMVGLGSKDWYALKLDMAITEALMRVRGSAPTGAQR